MNSNGLPESIADRNNTNRLDKMNTRGPNEGIQNHPQMGHSWDQPRTNPYLGTSYTPGSVAANPIGGGAHSYSPGTLGQYTDGGSAMKYGMASQSLGITPSSQPRFQENPMRPLTMAAGQGFNNTGGNGMSQINASPTSPVASAPPNQSTSQHPIGMFDGAVQTVKNAYNGALNSLGSAIQPAVNYFSGVGESAEALKKTTDLLGRTMQAHPEHVTQPTIDSYVTAQRQIARNQGTPLPAGVPQQGVINNAPVPSGMPNPVPLSSLPGAKEVSTPSPTSPSVSATSPAPSPAVDWNAKFKHLTGTAFNPKSAADRTSMQMLQKKLSTPDFVKKNNPSWDPTMSTAQYHQYKSGQR